MGLCDFESGRWGRCALVHVHLCKQGWRWLAQMQRRSGGECNCPVLSLDALAALTDAAPVVLDRVHSEEVEATVRRVGHPQPPIVGVHVRVVDDDNQPLGPDEVGELVLKGPSGCSGYWNNPEATAAVVDDEGWFHTGDMVYHDEEWYFYVVDRKKDMFISGGENVYPAEIEAVIYKHPAVHMCAVIGVPHRRWGEVGLACVVLKPGASATEEELIAFMQDHLARFKVPKSVEFQTELPISAAGKILKRELQERLVS